MREALLRLFLRWATERTNLVLGLSLVFALGGGLLAAAKLKIDSDQDHLISPDLPFHGRYLRFLDEFGDLEYLHAVIDGRSDPERARDFADALAAELRRQPEHFTRVHARLETADLGQNLLLLAPEPELRELELLSESPEDMRGVAASRSLGDLFRHFASSLERSSPEASAQAQERGWRLLQGLVAAVDSAARAGPGAPPPDSEPLADLLLPPLEVPRESAYEVHGGFVLVSFMPVKDYGSLDPIEAPLRLSREALTQLKERFPGVRAGVTGRPALTSDEVRRSSRDMTFASILAVVGVALVFMAFFRGVLRPLVTVASLMFGVAWAAGFATLALGQLNFLSSVFGVILVGIGIDFGIHLLARYQQALAGSGDVKGALEDALLHAGPGNLTAALTTSLAFFASLLTDFEGLAQLGLIAGTGVLLCGLSMLLVLPAALYRIDRGRTPTLRPLPAFVGLERLSARPGWTLVVVVLLTLGAGVAARGVRFDQNLLELQAQSEESVIWERELMNTDTSTWVTASIVDSVEEACARHDALAALEPVARVESIAGFLGPEAQATQARVAAIGSALGPLDTGSPKARVEGPRLAGALRSFGSALEDLAEVAIANGRAEETEAILKLADRADDLAGRLPETSASLDALQTSLLTTIQARCARLSRLLSPPGWTLENLPEWIRGRLVGKGGRLAVYAFPGESLWAPEAMDRFLGALRSVDPEVTGASVSVSDSSAILRAAFKTSVGLTAIAVLLLLLLEYRHWRGLIALVPLAVGGAWFLGAMALLGVSFNMGNFFIVSVLIGLGVDDGVHMLNRGLEDPQGSLVGHATGTGVILSSITTIVGFGTLMTSDHAGIASMGEVMALGASALLASALVAQPALTRLLLRPEASEPAGSEAPPPATAPS